jgi:hypothetical protein
MRPVGTPTQPAMARFCVTARTNMPRRVLFISAQTSTSTKRAKPTMTMRFQRQHDGRQESRCRPTSRSGWRLRRSAHRKSRVRPGSASATGPRWRAGFQRAAVEPADHRALEQHADQRRRRRRRPALRPAGTSRPGRGSSCETGPAWRRCRIGPDHQQLAVSHVDDTHHAVGDGQAQAASSRMEPS